MGEKKLVQLVRRTDQDGEREDENGGLPLGPVGIRFPPGSPEQPGEKPKLAEVYDFVHPDREGTTRE